MKKKNLSNQSGVAREIESPAVIASEAIETAASIPHVISAGFELGVFKAIGTLAIKGMAFAGYVVGAAGIVVSGLVLGADLGISAAIGLAGYKVSQGIETKEVTSKLLALSALGVELNISDQDYKKYKESLSWRQRTFYGERNLYNAYLNSKISEFTEEYTKTPLADKFQGFKETFADHKLIKAKQKKGLGERIFSMFEDNTKPIDSFLIRIAANNETICDPKCSIWDGLNPQNLVKPNENKFEIDSFSQRLAGLRNETKAQAVTSAPRRQIGEEFDLDAVEEAGAIEMVEINKYGINGKEHEPQEDKAISSSRFLELLEHSHNPYKEK